MKRYIFLTFIFLFSFLTVPSLSRGEEKPLVGQGEAQPSWLAFGLRSNYFRLEQSRRTIVGNLLAMDEDQTYIPYNPVVQFNFSKYFALEFGLNQFKATALNNDYLRWASDGDLAWTSYMLGLQFRWPHFHKSFVPYFSGGVSYNRNSFQRQEWYYYGFPGPDTYTSWVSQGNKPEDYPNNGYRRIHTVDDSYGVYLGLGGDFFLTRNWALNLDWRYHWSQANWTYQLINNDGLLRNVPGTVILDSWILGLGVKYFF